ncbi:MAG: hypothetical protein A2X25_03950 [Chloroflexi bacterium GWB2_49_20]|nr:MAG: hypothetical protein A2X25_03950 [Chloroflexi bacterium GWB2_49_20]OGN76737.1 MAG: hypothetical protein A2X26_11040 [Chloroflexi bacterium GWC2_49_37]OGN83697.1 MAG: hypothetical protein A2X27_01695 [Chloroflexi bacterium GWD2_49_16]HBG74180.1 hypothetical protein [Anaerolineae bacterium]HCC79002.1 hypothetical protein [Anaerolineae bacterium]
MADPKKIIRALPEHGWCFVCGRDNPKSLEVRWNLMEDQSISTQVTLDLSQQGPPGFAHGGASAALLDEAMGSAVWSAGYQVAAVNLQVNYLKPLPLNQPIRVNANIEKTEGRAVHANSSISLEDGTILVTGHGVYVEAPFLFEKIWKHINPYD